MIDRPALQEPAPPPAEWPPLEEWLPWKSYREKLNDALRRAAQGASSRGAAPREAEALELLQEAEGHAHEAWEAFRRRRLGPAEAWKVLEADLGGVQGWARALEVPVVWWKGKIMQRTLFATAASALCLVGVLGLTPASAPEAMMRSARADAPEQKKEEADSEETLAKRLSTLIDVDLQDAPCHEAVDFLRQTAGVQVFIHRQQLEAAGLSLDVPVSLNLKRIKVSTVLDLLVRVAFGGEAGYYSQDGIIFLTAASDPRFQDRQLEVRVYNCRDLLRIPSLPKRQAAEAGAGGDAKELAAKALRIVEQKLAAEGAGGVFGQPPADESGELIRVLQSAGPVQDWEDNGGTASIKAFNGLMTVRTKPEIHRNIENLLKMLRESVKDELLR